MLVWIHSENVGHNLEKMLLINGKMSLNYCFTDAALISRTA